MALVAGVVFFVVRALLALSPALAMRHAIKKWAALAALIAAFLYLLLSGAEVATQRSFIMTAIVLVAVMLDRSALTLAQSRACGARRDAARAGGGRASELPDVVCGDARADRRLRARAAVGRRRREHIDRREDCVVGRARDRRADPGVAGRRPRDHALRRLPLPSRLRPMASWRICSAMPIVSIWVMPCGIAALVALPFGFDAPLWRLMGLGIDWMIAVALFVASLPGAVGRVTAFGAGPLLLCTFGLVLLGLLRSPLRWSGALAVVAAALWAARTPAPDVYVADRGDVVAVRGASGRLSVMRVANSDAFTVREWLAADADARTPKDASLERRRDLRRDRLRRAARRRVRSWRCRSPRKHSKRTAARRHSSSASAPRRRHARRRRSIARCGSTPARARFIGPARGGRRWSAYPAGYDRPWARAKPLAGVVQSAPTKAQSASRDATPRTEDLAPED